MDLLIDTHAVIWFITEDSKLPLKTKKIIENSDRMTITQAICENLKIVTKDDYFRNYSASLIWNK